MAPANLVDFNERARSDLFKLLGDVPGKKNLVIQKSFVGRIELLFKFSTLQEQGIDKVFVLENDNVDVSQRNVIFIVSGEKAQQTLALAAQIKRLQQTTSADHDFTVVWTPRRTVVCEKIMEDEGVLGDVTSVEWSLYFHTLEKDILSMELEDSFGELCLRRDPTSLFLAAKALTSLEQEHGLFPRILGKGDNAKRLAELVVRMRSEALTTNGTTRNNKLSHEVMPSTTIEHLIIIDRDADMATPLMTQLTYEGLIDEIFDIQHGQAEVSASIVGGAGAQQPQSTPSPQGQSSSLKRKIKLDSNDKLYESLRDANFAIVGGLLNKVARRLQNDYDSGRGERSVAELRDFVGKLPGYQSEQQSLKIHTGLAEEVMTRTKVDAFTRSLQMQQNLIAGTDPSALTEELEDLIARDAPLPSVLRLLCLGSTVAGGLRAKDFDNFRKQILQAYGYSHLVTLDNLIKMQLLQSRGSTGAFYFPSGVVTAQASSKTDYSTLRRSLNLIVDEVSEQDPSDIAYTFSGYAPLSVRLVQCILQKPYLAGLTKSGTAGMYTESSSGWLGFEDILKIVKGTTFDEVQTSKEKSVKARQTLSATGGRKTSVVFFLGGITFAEIAALRFVARQEKERREILICSTSIISGDKMMRAAMEGDGV